MEHDCILLPINKELIPFHISCVKNVSTQQEGKITSLRINFNIPGMTVSSKISFPDPNTQSYTPIYIKELTFCSVRGDHLLQIQKGVKELQRAYKQKEIMDETVDYRGGLIREQGRKPVLKDLKMRPTLSGRKTVGTLESHKNGFRFVSYKGNHVDILFSNIKHAFYQPCDGEMIILIHFHLKNPIVVGKKKANDVQFYTEAGNISEDLTSNFSIN